MEHTWVYLKNEIKSTYNMIPNKNFILCIGEAEILLKISEFKDTSKKLEILNKLFKLVYETNEFNLFSNEELVDMINYDY